MVKFKKQSKFNYYIYDNVGFPIGSIYNKDFRVHLVLDVSIGHTSLIKLLEEIKKSRDAFEIDVGYGDYILGV